MQNIKDWPSYMDRADFTSEQRSIMGEAFDKVKYWYALRDNPDWKNSITD